MLGPAGFGKTTLVARWVGTDTRHVSWVDLEPGDDDPAVLFATLREAVAGIYCLPTPAIEHAAAVSPFIRAVEDGIAGSRRPIPFVLVLDNVHQVHGAEGSRLIQTIVAHLDPDSTVVLIGHGHHDHGTLGRLRLAPGVIDITVDDLRLDPSETHALLRESGVDASLPEVADLVSLLEGWPAGVLLAAEVLAASPTPVGIADHVGFVDYVRDEWLATLDDGDRTFLHEAAVLDPLTSDLCDEVLERSGSAAWLERLHRNHGVVFAVDQQRTVYRLHSMLRAHLSAALQQTDERRWHEIHVRAASHWERHGDVDRAAGHLRAVDELAALEVLAMTHGGRLFVAGRDETIENWLSAFTPDHLRASPALCGLQCIGALHRGDEYRALQWLRLHDEAVAALGTPTDQSTTWWATVLHAALDERPAADLIPGVAAARQALAGGPWGGFACWVHGALSFIEGDLDVAATALEAGLFEAELTGGDLLAGHCRATMAIIDDCVGDEAAAARNAQLASEAIDASGGQFLPPTASVMAVGALQHARGGDRGNAVLAMAAAREALTVFRQVAPWFNVITRLALVRTALILDDRATARELVTELTHHARLETDRTGHRQGAITCIDALREQVESMHIQATGSSALTDSELRVLHLLPTNLSLADIASQLYVSRNTVKTHAASIYRKLGVDRRGAAVEQARAAGLLPPTSTR